MTLNGKQPLMTLSLTADYTAIKRLGINLEEISPKFQEAANSLLTIIHPNIEMVDVARSAAYATSFVESPEAILQIKAIFQAYEKTISAEMQEREKKAIKEVESRRNFLREANIRGYFRKEIVSNIMLGSKLTVSHIDFVDNIVTFKLKK